MPGFNYAWDRPSNSSISASNLAPMGPPRPVVADTLSSSQVRFTGLQAISNMLPFLMMSTRNGDVLPAGSQPGQVGSGAASGSAGAGSGGGTGSKVASKTVSTPATTPAAPESSRSSENNQLVQALLAKMFGEDEDEELKGLRTELTRERLRMELNRQRMEHRAEMRKMQAQKRAEDLARREADRVRGQAHRERTMKNGPGVRGQIEVDESQVKRASPEQPRSKAERKAAYEAGVSEAQRKRHARNLGIDEREFDYINTNVSARDYGARLQQRFMDENRAEEARARGRAKFEESM